MFFAQFSVVAGMSQAFVEEIGNGAERYASDQTVIPTLWGNFKTGFDKIKTWQHYVFLHPIIIFNLYQYQNSKSIGKFVKKINQSKANFSLLLLNNTEICTKTG